ncbi:MAG: hypothetical protein M1834_000419 [Cirrosporium novae-zelandiae]|nr:MAG: hypothetical protein M1834_000419 [Cirrosporium novae-zelandiae]
MPPKPPTSKLKLSLPLAARPRAASTSTSSYAHLTATLPRRHLPLLYDYLTPQPSHLLNVTLSSFLPKHAIPAILPSVTSELPLPPSHHLVYFPPPTPIPLLLPDGTDPQLSPGKPFTRRMWAGGHMYFPSPPMLLDGSRAVCAERITDVKIRGSAGNEKIFVSVERRMSNVLEGEDEEGIMERVWGIEGEEEAEDGAGVEELWGNGGGVQVVERREMVFMRGRSEEELDKAREEAMAGNRKPGKIIKAPHPPTYVHTLVPTQPLLFRYSALTMNAHQIHLSPLYSLHHEAHPSLLVHGPLSLTLMLSVLSAHLSSLHPDSASRPAIREVSYRNIAPMYCGEELRVCVREKEGDNGNGNGDRCGGAWEIWCEGADGGVKVKGRARVGMPGEEERWGWGFWDDIGELRGGEI